MTVQVIQFRVTRDGSYKMSSGKISVNFVFMEQ